MKLKHRLLPTAYDNIDAELHVLVVIIIGRENVFFFILNNHIFFIYYNK